MAKRYVGVKNVYSKMKQGVGSKMDIVGVEVRARNERSARKQIADVISAAYPDAINSDETQADVTRLKHSQGVWRPVQARVAELLPRVGTWIAPKDVEMSNIIVDEKVDTGKEVVALADKTTPLASASKPAAKRVELGLTDEFIRKMGNSVKRYNATNEVI